MVSKIFKLFSILSASILWIYNFSSGNVYWAGFMDLGKEKK